MTAGERERLARGWAHYLRLMERIRRERTGEPCLRIMSRDGERR